jgi:hypothetical protein
MNGRTELFDNRLADWLEDDPVVAPPQLLETVLAAMPSIPQRRCRQTPSLSRKAAAISIACWRGCAPHCG